MPLKHSLVTEDEDFYKFTPRVFEAIHFNGFVDACWPDNLTKEGQQRHAEGFIAHKRIDPTVVWNKVIDTDTGDMIGVSQWLVLRDQKPPQFNWDGPPGTWKNDTEKSYAQEIWRSFSKYRYETLEHNELPIIALSIMIVHPSHQYRGAGTLVMDWGTQLADEINALSLVEATLAGRWLYEKSGFNVKHHYAVEAENFGRGAAQRLFYMEKPRARRH